MTSLPEEARRPGPIRGALIVELEPWIEVDGTGPVSPELAAVAGIEPTGGRARPEDWLSDESARALGELARRLERGAGAEGIFVTARGGRRLELLVSRGTDGLSLLVRSAERHHALLENLEHLYKDLDHTAEAVMLVGPDGRVQAVSRPMVELFGRPDLVGHTLSELLGPAGADPSPAFLADESFTGELRLRTSGLDPVPVIAAIHPVETEAGLLGRVVRCHDLRPRRAAERRAHLLGLLLRQGRQQPGVRMDPLPTLALGLGPVAAATFERDGEGWALVGRWGAEAAVEALTAAVGARGERGLGARRDLPSEGLRLELAERGPFLAALSFPAARALGREEEGFLSAAALAVAAQWSRAQAHVALSESEARYRDLLARVSDAIVLLGPDGGVEVLNPAAEVILGHPPEALLGHAWLERLPPATLARGAAALGLDAPPLGEGDDPLAWLSALRVRPDAERASHRLEAELPLPGGGTRILEVTARIDTDDTRAVLGVVAVLRDATERKAQLETLAAKSAELERLSELKREVVAVTSHDLRSPLATMVGYAQLLKDRRAQLTPEKWAQYSSGIAGAAHRMTEFIQNLLDLERIKAGALSLDRRRGRLRPAIAEALEACVGSANARGVRLDLRPGADPEAEFDPLRIQQVVGNLVGNAIKFSPPGSAVTVQLVERGPGRVELSVEDRGPGIPEAELERVFAPNYQGQTPQASQGIGLGLHIARTIVAAHGGRLWATNTGAGCRMLAELPTRSPAEGADG